MSEQVVENKKRLPDVFKDFSLELIKIEGSKFVEFNPFAIYKTKENIYKDARYGYFLNRYFCLALRIIWDYKEPIYITLDEVNYYFVKEDTKFDDFSNFFERFK